MGRSSRRSRMDESAGVSPEIRRVEWLDLNPAFMARLAMLEFERDELAHGLEPPAVGLGLSR